MRAITAPSKGTECGKWKEQQTTAINSSDLPCRDWWSWKLQSHRMPVYQPRNNEDGPLGFIDSYLFPPANTCDNGYFCRTLKTASLLEEPVTTTMCHGHMCSESGMQMVLGWAVQGYGMITPWPVNCPCFLFWRDMDTLIKGMIVVHGWGCFRCDAGKETIGTETLTDINSEMYKSFGEERGWLEQAKALAHLQSRSIPRNRKSPWRYKRPWLPAATHRY